MTQVRENITAGSSPWLARVRRLSIRVKVTAPLVFVMSCVALGCSSQGKPKSPEGADAEAGKHSSQAAAPLPALEPVAAPDGVIARFRLANPQKLADGLLDAASIPFDLSQAIKRMDGDATFLRAMDMTAPIEAAFVLNPEDPLNPSRFLSVGVVGVDDVLRLLEESKLTVQEGPGGVHHFLVASGTCAVGRSVGKSPARVVCSDRQGGLHQLLPYALRGFPNEKLSDADVYTQLDFKPVRTRYKKELDRLRLLASVFARQGHVGHAKFDRALTDAAIALADELTRVAQESDQFVLEVRERGGHANIVARASFDGEASTLVQSLRAQNKLQASAPELFTQLPSAAAAGFYMRELPAESLDVWVSIVSDLLGGYAEHRGASVEFGKRLAQVVRHLSPQSRTHVQASGPLVSTIEKGSPVVRPSWTLFGTTTKKAEIITFLDNVAWLLSSPDWLKVAETKGAPAQVKRSKKTLNAVPGATVYEWSMSQQIMDELQGEFGGGSSSKKEIGKTAQNLSKGYIVVFELDGKSYISWVAGDNMAPLAEGFRALNEADSEGLANVPTHKKIIDDPAVAAGFMTLSGTGGELWSFAPAEIIKDLTGLINATPHRGRVPMTMSYRSKVAQGTEAEYEVTLPREFIQDAATLAAIAFTEMDTDF